MKKLFFLMLLLYQASNAMPVDTNVFKYFPFNVGNRWTWYIDQHWNPGPGYETMNIQSTIVVNNHKYYVARHDVYYFYNNQHYNSNYYIRIDSTTGNLFRYDIQNQMECLTDSLNSQINDSANIGCQSVWYK